MNTAQEDSTHVIQLTKLEAARRQINTAIRMYFLDMDAVSTHAVLAGGLQIVSDLAAKKGQQVGFEKFLAPIIEERRKEFLLIIREPQNFLKHADREGDDTIIYEYRTGVLEIYLYLAAQSYQTFTGKATPEIKSIITWISFRNPEILIEDEYKKNVDSYLERYGKVDALDKPMFLSNIDKFRNERPVDETLMDYSV